MSLADATPGTTAVLHRLGGSRAFRRRLMELGLLPGTTLQVVGRAPFGGPVELLVRGCCLSIRSEDAADLELVPGSLAKAPPPGPLPAATPPSPRSVDAVALASLAATLGGER